MHMTRLNIHFNDLYLLIQQQRIFSTWNRNKRSIPLDISRPRAKELALRLVGMCDMVVENFSSCKAVCTLVGLGRIAKWMSNLFEHWRLVRQSADRSEFHAGDSE